MKSNRPKSKNVQDDTAYFGTSSVDKGYVFDDRTYDFLKQGLLSPYLNGPEQHFGVPKPPSMTMEQMLAWLASQNARPWGLTLDSRFNSGVL